MEEALTDAVAFADAFASIPDADPGFTRAWAGTRDQWRGCLDRGDYLLGITMATEKVRHVGCEAGDWFEHTGDPRYGEMSGKCLRKLEQWRTSLGPVLQTGGHHALGPYPRTAFMVRFFVGPLRILMNETEVIERNLPSLPGLCGTVQEAEAKAAAWVAASGLTPA